ncbi:hypothetical protein Egran_03491 [Elaphomyces granulatus]|uniref:DUF659 domain-containing protein n=1 Tax=Elaphomyces granulatus TaxID=519963 RepID=A0A232LX60_9EURO|nr:hypothetical protein Egran_03491 [Elaphomyces granulatus]
MALFAGARPFSTFESVEMKEFIKALNPNYTIPSHQRFAESILDDCYAYTQNQVYQQLNKSQYLNVTVDETTDIRKRRIMNISVTDSERSFCIALKYLKGEKMNAASITDWIVERIDDLVDGNFSRINSIATDTCNTMMAVWRNLREREELADAFAMGCDSHGLQLLIGDLLKTGNIKVTFQMAQGIVSHFNSSPLQLATLRKIQQTINRTEFALIGAVITRWGSQYRMLSSVLRSQYALMMYADEVSDLKIELRETLRSSDFWNHLKKLIAILKPIDDAISIHTLTPSSVLRFAPF